MGLNPIRNLVVQKFGGATLATPALVRQAAERIAAQSKKGPLLVVVSAMGQTTNQLLDLARQVSPRPSRRELDMLLSVGERISMSLVSMALNDLGCPAISLTGSQAGILTDHSHSGARIIEIRASRVEEALRQGKVVVLAGFQGMSPVTKEITTLGRGGSDVTAVALAAAFGADRCEILKEMPSVFSADPKQFSRAQALPRLSPAQLCEMTYWGAKFLHYRAAELARAQSISLEIKSAEDPHAPGTQITGENDMYEDSRPLALNSLDTIFEIESQAHPFRLQEFEKTLQELEVSAPQILNLRRTGAAGTRLLITGPRENLEPLLTLDPVSTRLKLIHADLAGVSLTCTGAVPNLVIDQGLEVLRQQEIHPYEVLLSPLSFCVIIDKAKKKEALEALQGLLR